MKGDLEAHELADAMPRMDEEQFAGLVEEIRENGLRVPIVTYQGRILDGRHRAAACAAAGVAPRYVESRARNDAEALLEVVALNVRRRHLSASQRALIAARLLPALELAARRRQVEAAMRTNTLRAGLPGASPIPGGSINGTPPPQGSTAADECALVLEPPAADECLGPPGRARDAAAAAVGVSPRLVQSAKVVLVAGDEEVVAAVESGELSVTAAVDATRKESHVARSSGDVEWYTPPEIIALARRVMGRIDLDPASCDAAQRIVQAEKYYTAADDGLSQRWSGKVWMNPPYARYVCERWAAHLVDCLDDIEEAIVLTNNATDTEWWQLMARHASARCDPDARISFHRADGPRRRPLQGQVVLYLGPDPVRFCEVFSELGLCWRAVEVG